MFWPLWNSLIQSFLAFVSTNLHVCYCSINVESWPTCNWIVYCKRFKFEWSPTNVTSKQNALIKFKSLSGNLKSLLQITSYLSCLSVIPMLGCFHNHLYNLCILFWCDSCETPHIRTVRIPMWRLTKIILVSLHVGIDIGIDFSGKKMTSTTTLLGW